MGVVCKEVPQALLQQLAGDGCMLLPLLDHSPHPSGRLRGKLTCVLKRPQHGAAPKSGYASSSSSITTSTSTLLNCCLRGPEPWQGVFQTQRGGV